MTSQFNDGVEASVKRTRRILLFVWIAVFAVVIGNKIGKAYMEQKDREVAYQVVMQEIQETVTEYLVNNYAGITKVEWQGVGVKFLASDVVGHSMYPNYVSTEVRVYVNDTDYFTVEARLNDEAQYDHPTERYILKETARTKNRAPSIEAGLRNALGAYSVGDPDAFAGFVESDAGSPGAEITYNVDIFKFDW